MNGLSNVIKKRSVWFKRLAVTGSLKQYYTIYLVAFALIAVIAVLSQVFIQNFLGKQTEDSYLINVAGKQRMLSQKITKNLLYYTHNWSDSIQVNTQKDLNYWSEKHEKLRTEKVIHTKYNTPSIHVKYDSLEIYFQSIFIHSNQYLASKNQLDLDKVQFAEQKYLYFMDQIVNEYDKNYQYKITLLRRIEFGLSALLVLVLILEMFLVFIPLIKTLSSSLERITHSEQKAKELAKNLYLSNSDLNNKNKEISDIHFALDKAVILIKTDPNGNIIYANQQYCLLTKYNIDQLIDKPLFYNNLGGSESIIYQHIKDEKINRTVWQSEVHDTASDATDFWLDVTLFPIINNTGILYEYLLICSDITKRKVAENELVILNEKKFLKQEKEQRIRSKSIIEGQEVERKRMAKEVHDGLGQMLTALKFNCEALEAEDHQQVVVQNMRSLLHQVIVETRRISSDLVPSTLLDFGLAAAIKEMVHSLQKVIASGLTINAFIELDSRTSNEKEIALYRIAQEAINNALKHSKAKNIHLKLSADAEYIYLVISDNGIGYEVDLVKNSKFGNGLRNMKERTNLVEGKISIQSNTEKGTIISVEIPLN